MLSRDGETLQLAPCGMSGQYTVPDRITAIGDYAFYACRLSAINTNKAKSIGRDSFSRCFLLKTAVFMPDLETIGMDAFYYCTALTDISFSEGIKSIDVESFSRCSKLQTVSIPDSVISIGRNAFRENAELETVVLGTGLKEIPAYCFYNCKALLNVTVKGALDSIGDYAFSSCSLLSSNLIQPSVTAIGDRAFYNCSSLPDGIDLSHVTEKLGYYAFSGCVNLSKVEIVAPTLYGRTFEACTGLQKVWIRSGVETVYVDSVSVDGNLRSVYGPFYNCNSSLLLYCEDSSRPAGWNERWNVYSGLSTTLTTIWNQKTSPF